MDNFSTRILTMISSRGLIFPGLDDQAILDRVVPVAEEWIMMQLVTYHLSLDDQGLWRDAYLSAPDVFDPVEFLSDTIPDFDTVFDHYFDTWLQDFGSRL